MNIVLRELDKEKFRKNVVASLDLDDYYDGCNTNFKDILIETIIQTISEIVERDNWNLQHFTKEESEKLFNAFIVNSKITIRLNKKIDGATYYFKAVTIEFNFPENEKKKIAEIYLENLFNYSFYIENCIVENLKEIDIDLLALYFNIQVYQFLSLEEIIEKYEDKLKEIVSNG